jgi:DNA-directed RNA polymerase specialized sigma subunit
VNVVTHTDVIIHQYESLLASEGRSVTPEMLFEKQNMSLKEVRELVSTMKKTNAESMAEIEKATRAYARAIADILIAKASESGRQTEREAFARACINDLLDFNKRAILATLLPFSSDPGLAEVLKGVSLTEMQATGDLLETRGCDAFDSGSPRMNERLNRIYGRFLEAREQLALASESTPTAVPR